MSQKSWQICLDEKANANAFKEFFCNLAGNFDAKLPLSSNIFELDAVRRYYQGILSLLSSEFKFSNLTKNLALQLLKDINLDKAADIDNFCLSE